MPIPLATRATLTNAANRQADLACAAYLSGDLSGFARHIANADRLRRILASSGASQ